VVRNKKKRTTTCGQEYENPTAVVCPQCRMWGEVLEVSEAHLEYGDGEKVELGDTVEVNDRPDEFEPEEAKVIRLGSSKIRVEYINEHIKPRKVFVMPGHCELIAREG
jgi:hypothetical protein